MHICLIYNEYPEETDNGGISTYQYNLARALYEKGNEITVIASSFVEEKEYVEDGIRVIRLKNNLFGSANEQLRYRENILAKVMSINKEKKIDIIETPDMGAEGLCCTGNNEIPVIVKLHTSYKLWSEFNGPLLENAMHKQMISWEQEQLNKADYIISCTKILKKIVKKDIKNRKIDVVPNPINIDDFFPMNIRRESKKILYCGSLENRKGVLVFVKSIPYILKSLGNEIEFVFVGKDSIYNGEKMSRVIFRELPERFHKNIKIYGKVNKNLLNNIFNEAAIGVIPSLFDNLPYVAMEELLTELPIVISENTGITKILIRNNAAVSFKSGDYEQLAKKVINLFKSKKRKYIVGRKGRKLIIKKFSSEEIADIMLLKYKKVIKKFKRGGK